jgi:hypothetical protein
MIDDIYFIQTLTVEYQSYQISCLGICEALVLGCKPTFLAVLIVLFSSSRAVVCIANSLTRVTNEKPINKFCAICGTRSFFSLNAKRFDHCDRKMTIFS